MSKQHSEHVKLKAVKDRSEACGSFIDWLHSKGVSLTQWKDVHYVCTTCGEVPEKEIRRCGWNAGHTHYHCNQDCGEAGVERIGAQFHPYNKPIERILAEYFEIDLDKLELEKRAMLDELRKENG